MGRICISDQSFRFVSVTVPDSDLVSSLNDYSVDAGPVTPLTRAKKSLIILRFWK